MALAAAEAVIDFTLPEASVALAEEAAANGGPALVIGSTGFSDEQLARIDEAAKTIAIVRSGNYSLGVNMLMGLVRQAAAALPAQDWDIEVYEAHHKRKIDAPSGTALMLGEAAAQGRGVALSQVADRGRDGVTGRSIPQADRIEVLSKRAMKWAGLLRKKNADKKVAVTVFSFPPDKGNVGTARRPRIAFK